MTLPSVQTIPVATSLYPDSIIVAYQYLLSHTGPLGALLPALREVGDFTNIRGGFAARTRVICSFLQEPVEVEVSRSGPNAPLRFLAFLNPLRDLHCRRSDYGDERGRNAAHNWLHSDEIGDNNTNIAEHAQAMIAMVENALFALLEDIAQAQRWRFELEGIYVKRLEVAYDLAASDPEAMTSRLGRVVQQRFRHSITPTYRSSACGYQSFDNDTYMISGFSREGERYKVYSKTNARCRLECRVDPAAFRAMGLQRDILRYSDQFAALFTAVAERVHPNFLEILEVAPGSPIASAGPLDLMTQLAHSIKGTEVLRDVIVALAASGRITRDFGRRGLGSRLHEAGILQRVGRGLYAIAPRYKDALRIVSNTQQSWLDFTPTQEGRP